MVTGLDQDRSFNLTQVKRKAALMLVRDFAHSEYKERVSHIEHIVIKAEEYQVIGVSEMEVK